MKVQATPIAGADTNCPMKSVAHTFQDQPATLHDKLGALVRAPAITVAAAPPLGEVQRLLVHERIPAVAVVDEDGSVRGIVTRTDVLRTVGTRDATAGDAMSHFVFTLPAAAFVEKAAALMAYEGVGQVLVADLEGRLLGMVSALDIARHYAARAGYRT